MPNGLFSLSLYTLFSALKKPTKNMLRYKWFAQILKAFEIRCVQMPYRCKAAKWEKIKVRNINLSPIKKNESKKTAQQSKRYKSKIRYKTEWKWKVKRWYCVCARLFTMRFIFYGGSCFFTWINHNLNVNGAVVRRSSSLSIPLSLIAVLFCLPFVSSAIFSSATFAVFVHFHATYDALGENTHFKAILLSTPYHLLYAFYLYSKVWLPFQCACHPFRNKNSREMKKEMISLFESTSHRTWNNKNASDIVFCIHFIHVKPNIRHTEGNPFSFHQQKLFEPLRPSIIIVLISKPSTQKQRNGGRAWEARKKTKLKMKIRTRDFC